MPAGGEVDLGHAVWRLLAWSLAASAGLAVVVAVVVAWASAARPTVAARLATLTTPSVPDAVEPTARRVLRSAFGLLWIIDGLLQAQPRMSAAFVPEVLQAHADGPGWFAALVAPFARAWSRHPVLADAASVWVQVGIGVALLVLRAGPVARVALWASIAWSAAVWTVGEGLGGLVARGATWLTGAPGAVLLYAVAAWLLLLPWEAWPGGRAAMLARRSAAAWMVLAGLLQAAPFEQAWSSRGAAAAFRDTAGMPLPASLAAPARDLARLAAAHPVPVNLAVVLIVLAAGVLLWFDARPGVAALAVTICAGTWWLAQGFGVLGGTATDPNTALPLAVLVGVGALAPSAREVEPVRAQAGTREPPRPHPTGPRWLPGRAGARAGGLALLAAITVAVPSIIAAALSGPADASALAVDSNGGVVRLPPRPAPAFSLTDQRGRQVSSAGLHGRLVVLTFLDPVCNSDCPLVAQQLAIADRRLGGIAGRVEFVAVDVNPLFDRRADVAAFTRSHGLAGLRNWHFVTGSPGAVQAALDGYGVSVDVPSVGMVEHAEAVWFIRPDGTQAAYLEDGASSGLTSTYAARVEAEIRTLLA